ncbi:thiamine pyrophosphate-dependent enzyme, partial [Klebsiella pneumoniae]
GIHSPSRVFADLGGFTMAGLAQGLGAGQAGPLGWTIPAALGVVKADPSRQVVALSGDYDFQFMIEELAVGAQ